MELTGTEKKHLRGLAHSNKPVTFLGKNGVTEEFMKAIDTALEAHELIKIKFADFKDERKTLAREIAEKAEAVLCGVIGNNAILYRMHPDQDKRKVRLS